MVKLAGCYYLPLWIHVLLFIVYIKVLLLIVVLLVKYFVSVENGAKM